MRTSETSHLPVVVLSGVRVPMRDGVGLNLRITRPAPEGRYPAVMEYNPYRRLGPTTADDPGYPPVVRYLAERGYVVVQYDLRGTGSSSGFSTDIYADAERQDGYDMIEWIAAQPWCTGAVGMIGKSYGAVVQWQVAVQNPPHLKAIVVRSANNDVYTEFANPGGAIRPWMFEYYAPMMNAFNFAPPFAELTGARWASIWAERLEDSAPWSLGYIRNTLHGDYWRRRSLAPGFERVQCPVYLIEGWPDWYASAELEAYQRLRVPRKVLIGPWGHYYSEEPEAFPGPRIDTRPEYLRWFDHWLKGIDTGMMDEPPVTVFVRHWRTPSLLTLEDAGEWQNEAAWPPADVEPTAFHFDAQGALSRNPPANDGAENYQYRASVGLAAGRRGLGSTTPFGMPIDQRPDDAYSVLYATPPLDAPVTLLGEPAALLHVSSTAETAYFHVRLCDVAPDGAVALIADGGLLASHRSSHEAPEPIVPGEVYELSIKLRHTAYRIAAGHRLRVAVSSADFQNAWPTGVAAHNTVHRGRTHPSRVILPIAAADRHPLPPPSFHGSPHPIPTADAIERPGYSLSHDLVDDTVTCSLVSTGGSNRSAYTVSNCNPAHAVINSSYSYTAPHPTLDIRVVATCQTASDATSYIHSAQVEITVNGGRHFQKSWAESVPRYWS